MHGGEAQVGECRLKLVSFRPDSPQHKRARAVPRASATGSRGLLVREHLMKAIDEDGLFADWDEVPMQVARYELRGPNRQVSERPTILEMLALRERRPARRRAHRDAAPQPHARRRRVAPARSSSSCRWSGPTLDEARHVVEQVVSQVQGLLPETLELARHAGEGRAGPTGAGTLID